MNWINPLAGGILIGLSVTWMLLSTGRVTGISGIINSAIIKREEKPDKSAWRIFFLLGLICGGLILKLQNPEAFANTTDRSLLTLVIAGILVGFGTVVASGHGICGLSRWSIRSLVATMTFMIFGALTVFVYSRLFA